MDLNPLNQLNPLVISAAIVIVLVTYIVLKRWFVTPYVQVMESRERYLDESEAMLGEAHSLADEASQEAAELVAAAREDAERIRAEARERAERSRADELGEVARDVASRLEAGRARIAEARANELSQLRSQAVQCVGLACDRLFGDTDESAIEASVDHLMARRVQ